MTHNIREGEKRIIREAFAKSVNPATPVDNALKLISDMKDSVANDKISDKGNVQIIIEASECILDSYKQGRVGRLSTTTDAYVELIEEVVKKDKETYGFVAEGFLSDTFKFMSNAQVYPSPNRIKIGEAVKTCIKKLEA